MAPEAKNLEVQKNSLQNMAENMDINNLKNLLKDDGELIKKWTFGKKLNADLEHRFTHIVLTLHNNDKLRGVYEDKLSPDERLSLEKALSLISFKGTKEQQALFDQKVREINAIVGLAKQEESDLENDIHSTQERKMIFLINNLHEKWEYQQSLDTAVLLHKENPTASFSLIKQIFKATPAEETLFLKGKKISSSERKEWIQKMESNVEKTREDAKKAFEKNYYENIDNSNDWELEKDLAFLGSEKKALKAFIEKDKTLYRMLKRINIGSAFSVLNKKEEKSDITKDRLINNNYIPKNGKEIKNSELNAIQDLYRDYKDKDIYTKLADAATTGVSFQEIHAVKWVLEKVPSDKDQTKVLMLLFGDTNNDGKLINASTIEGKEREDADKWTIMGGQVAEMYKNAITRTGYENIEAGKTVVVQNIINLINTLHGFQNRDFKDIKTETDLINAFKNNPEMLLAFREKLQREPDSGMSIFYKGATYAEWEIQKIKDAETAKTKLQKEVQNFYEENDEKFKEADEEIKERQKISLDEAKIQLSAIIKELEKEKSADNAEKIKELETTLEQISDANVDNFLASETMQEARKNLIFAWAGLAVSSLTIDEQQINSISVGAGWQHKKVNEILSTTKIFDTATASVGLSLSGKNPVLGFGLSIGWGTALWKKKMVRVFHSAALGWSPQMATSLGAAYTAGVEAQYNNKKQGESLSVVSSKSIGLVGSVGIGVDLSSPDAIKTVMAQLYRKRDKLDGVEKQFEKVKSNIQPVFKEILEKWSNADAIAKKLQEKFPKTQGDTIYKIAVAMHNMISSYNLSGENAKENENIIQALSVDFANHFAQNHRNENIEQIIKEGWHLSQVGVGVSLLSAFTGFLWIGSLVFTKYNESSYIENGESKQEAFKKIHDSNEFDSITTGNLSQKINTINKLLDQRIDEDNNGKKYLEQKTEGEMKYIQVNENIFDTARVFIHPEIAPYIQTENGEIKIPDNAEISLATILRQGKEEQFVVFWANSLKGCSEVIPTQKEEDTSSLQRKEPRDIIFWTSGVDAYNLRDEIKEAGVEINLDNKANTALVEYLEAEEGSKDLVQFRSAKSSAYNSFISKMKAGRNGFEINELRKLLPRGIQNQVKTMDDIRFVYASLSRVSQTIDKQLKWGKEGTAMAKANEYLKNCKILSEDKAKLQQYIDKVNSRKPLNDTERETLRAILKPHDNWHYYNNPSPEGKLFNLLTPPKKLIDARKTEYAKKLAKEYEATSNTNDVVSYILSNREKAANQIQTTSAKGSIMDGYIGAVTGYGAEDIEEKFVGGPKIIDNSFVKMEENEQDKWILLEVKKNFLTEMIKHDPEQFNQIKNNVISTLEASADESDTTKVKKYKDMNNNEFITALVTDSKITFDLHIGFFADCINETVMMSNLKVEIKEKVKAPIPADVKYAEVVVTNYWVTTAKSVGIAAAVGKLDKKDGPDGSTDPDPEKIPESENKTEPLTDLDGLKADNIREVWGETITIDGNVYDHIKIDGNDGSTVVIAYNKTGTYQLLKEGSKVILYPINEDWTGLFVTVPPVISGISEVSGVSVIQIENPDFYKNMGHAINAHLISLIDSFRVKTKIAKKEIEKRSKERNTSKKNKNSAEETINIKEEESEKETEL